MSVFIKGDYREIDAEFDRLENMPGPATVAKLDAVLHQGFVATQVAVHEITGALKASGEENSEVHKTREQWEGDITYGSPGDAGPVDYAIYEKERDVGGAGGASNAKGDHNFMRPTEALDPLFRAAMLEALHP